MSTADRRSASGTAGEMIMSHVFSTFSFRIFRLVTFRPHPSNHALLSGCFFPMIWIPKNILAGLSPPCASLSLSLSQSSQSPRSLSVLARDRSLPPP